MRFVAELLRVWEQTFGLDLFSNPGQNRPIYVRHTKTAVWLCAQHLSDGVPFGVPFGFANKSVPV